VATPISARFLFPFVYQRPIPPAPAMRDFLSEFVRGSDAACTFIVMDEGYMEEPRRYHLRPFRVLAGALGVALGVALLAAAAVAFTPLRTLIPGYGTAQMEQNARQNARRAAALEDSVSEQRRYLRHLQRLMTGPVDSAFVAEAQEKAGTAAGGAAPVPARQAGEAPLPSVPPAHASGSGEAQRAKEGKLPEMTLPKTSVPGGSDLASPPRLDPVSFPVAPPVAGFATRGFAPEKGHYAVDIATEAGTPVRTIGDGYVVMAGRTKEGGQAIAVQHAQGYLSFYKHNRRLSKDVGDRVEAREAIAESGNSGEMTTGPHLHMELWRNGLAQNPAAYFIEE
jgi:murein DD-endopeptidase MepM/ murein hydrolase activator NlpD